MLSESRYHKVPATNVTFSTFSPEYKKSLVPFPILHIKEESDTSVLDAQKSHIITPKSTAEHRLRTTRDLRLETMFSGKIIGVLLGLLGVVTAQASFLSEIAALPNCVVSRMHQIYLCP